MLRSVVLASVLMVLSSSACFGNPQDELRGFGLRIRATIDESEPLAKSLRKREDVDAVVTFISSTAVCNMALGSTSGELDLLQFVTEPDRRIAGRRYIAAGTGHLLEALADQVDLVDIGMSMTGNEELLELMKEYADTLDEIVIYYKDLAVKLEDMDQDF